MRLRPMPFTRFIKALPLLAAILAGTSAAAPYPQISVGGERRPFIAETNARPYELLISYPFSYETHPERHYPVLIALDGYWDAKLLASIYGNLVYDQTIPEFIIVGIGYSDVEMNPEDERVIDFIPSDLSFGNQSTAGETFLQVIKSEIIPYLDTELRTDPSYRVLSGSSYGGFCVLNAMLEDPESFQAYISISPATGIGHRYLFQKESRYRTNDQMLRNHSSLPARLYMTAAEKEWLGFRGEILAFDQLLKHGAYEDFEYEFRMIEDERHAGTKGESYSRGIRHAFRPYLENQARQTE